MKRRWVVRIASILLLSLAFFWQYCAYLFDYYTKQYIIPALEEKKPYLSYSNIKVNKYLFSIALEDFQLTYNLDEAREDLLKGYDGDINDLKLVAATRKPLIIRHIPIINLNRISSDFNLQTFDTSSSNEPQRAEVYDFVFSFRSSNDNLQNISIKSGAILLYDAKMVIQYWLRKILISAETQNLFKK